MNNIDMENHSDIENHFNDNNPPIFYPKFQSTEYIIL